MQCIYIYVIDYDACTIYQLIREWKIAAQIKWCERNEWFTARHKKCILLANISREMKVSRLNSIINSCRIDEKTATAGTFPSQFKSWYFWIANEWDSKISVEKREMWQYWLLCWLTVYTASIRNRLYVMFVLAISSCLWQKHWLLNEAQTWNVNSQNNLPYCDASHGFVT